MQSRGFCCILVVLAVQLQQALAQKSLTYLGCFEDNRLRRDLPIVAKLISGSERLLTVEKCLQACKAGNHSYFGLQENLCYCANVYGIYGKADESKCNIDCSGNASQVCGGSLHNSVYSTGVVHSQPYKHIGCFQDNGRRDLAYVGHGGYGYMSPALCYQICTGQSTTFPANKKRYDYFGLQNSNQCFCGNYFGDYGRKPLSSCNFACTGDKSRHCGATWHNTVYSTRVAPKKPYTFIGCFLDRARTDLPLSPLRGAKMSSQICYKHCAKQNAKFFGTQAHYYCHCGNSYGRYSINKTITHCGTICTDDKSEYCGGGSYNSIFRIGDPLEIEVQQPKLVGCFVDVADDRRRDLPYHALTGNMSTVTCNRACTAQKFKYFGMQLDRCYCGNSYGIYGKARAVDCDTQCDGSVTERCGNANKNMVYGTQYEPEILHEPIGCFEEKAHKRDLEHLAAEKQMSHEECNSLCKTSSYKYFGLQNGKMCYCSNSYNAYGSKPMKECTIACDGNRGQHCGGYYRNLVFNVTDNDGDGGEDTGPGDNGNVGGNSDKIEQPFKYIGCFADNKIRRDMLIVSEPADLTPKLCYEKCKELNYSYFGLQNGKQCRCADKFGDYGKRQDRFCNVPCVGNSTSECGGALHNSVYATGINVTGNYQHIGCYVDELKRDMEVQVLAGVVSLAACGEQCQLRRFHYFGLQNGTLCFCGDTFGSYRPRRPITECNRVCSGDGSAYCGGYWRNDIYRINYHFGGDDQCKCKCGCTDNLPPNCGPQHQDPTSRPSSTPRPDVGTVTPDSQGRVTPDSQGRVTPVTPDSQGRVTPDSQGTVTPDSQSRGTTDSQGKVAPDSQGRVTPDSQGTVAPDSQGRVTPDSQGKVTPDSQGSATPDSQGTVTPDSQSRVTPDSQSRVTPDSQGRVTPDSQGRVTPDSQSRVTPDSQGRVTPDSQGRVTPDSQGSATPDSQGRVTPDLGTTTTTRSSTTLSNKFTAPTIVPRCQDPITLKYYVVGDKWITTDKANFACYHYSCSKHLQPEATETDCLDLDGKCIAATNEGSRYKCTKSSMQTYSKADLKVCLCKIVDGAVTKILTEEPYIS